jgi:hypothetical protein
LITILQNYSFSARKIKVLPLFNDFSNHWVSFCPSKRWGDQGGKVMIGRQGGRVSTALS